MEIKETALEVVLNRKEAAALEKGLRVLHDFMDSQEDARNGFSLQQQQTVEKLQLDLKRALE